MKKQEAYIHCRTCGKIIRAERTHNGIWECWLGHCCGFGQDAAIGDEVSNHLSTRIITKETEEL